MTSTVSPQTEDRLAALGGDPIRTTGWMIGGSILTILLATTMRSGTGLMLGLGGLGMLALSVRCGLSALAGSQFYKIAYHLVMTGQFTPTWTYRSFMCGGGGILLVDEPGRRVHLGGDTFDLSSIKEITYVVPSGPGAPQQGEISVVKSTGISPVRVLRVPRADVAQIAHRLANCIDGVEATMIPLHSQA
jgi:hypothetical protein